GDLYSWNRGCGRRNRIDIRTGGDRLGRGCRMGNHAQIQPGAPRRFEVTAWTLFLPVRAHDLVSSNGLNHQRGEQVVGGRTVVEGLNQRLDDRDGAVEGADIGPFLQVVRCRNVPLACLGGLVRVEPQMDAESRLGECVGDRNVRWSSVYGVA